MIAQDVISRYQAMWLFCFFDIPVKTKEDQKRAAHFRKLILEDGFHMHQFSVYTRHCGSKESLEVHQKRVISFVPVKGKVSLLAVTEKQYKDIINFWGVKFAPLKTSPQQLEFF